MFYPQDQATVPEGWVHNLEHGAMAVLYRCPEGCGTEAQAALAALQGQLPPSPVCGFPPTADVVVTRFDQMPKPYAAIVWGRVSYLNSPDVGQIKTFYLQSADKGPEPWCQQAMPGSARQPGPCGQPRAGGLARPDDGTVGGRGSRCASSPTSTSWTFRSRASSRTIAC